MTHGAKLSGLGTTVIVVMGENPIDRSNATSHLDLATVAIALHLDEVALHRHIKRDTCQMPAGAGPEALPMLQEAREGIDIQGLLHQEAFPQGEMYDIDHHLYEREGTRDHRFDQGRPSS